MGLTIGISGSLLCDKGGGQMTVSRVRQQYPVVCDVFVIGPRGAAVHVSYYLSYSEYRNRVRFPKDTGRPRRTVFASRQGFPVRSPSRQEHPRVNVPAIALSDTLSDGAFALPDPLPPAQLCNPSSGAKTGTD